jgi:hypothetical protein
MAILAFHSAYMALPLKEEMCHMFFIGNHQHLTHKGHRCHILTTWMDELHQCSCGNNLYMQSCISFKFFFLHFFARSLTSFASK